MTSDPSVKKSAEYFAPLRPAPLLPDPQQELRCCTKCQKPIGERVTAYGNLWVDRQGSGQCRSQQGGLHTPPS